MNSVARIFEPASLIVAINREALSLPRLRPRIDHKNPRLWRKTDVGDIARFCYLVGEMYVSPHPNYSVSRRTPSRFRR